AETIDPEAFALLLDIDGYLTESTGANFFIVKNGVLYTPTKKNIVDGISRETVIELAQNMGIKVIEKDIEIKETLNADEAFFTATTYCILPIRSINNISIGKDVPGYYTKELINSWGQMVGLDIIKQAQKNSKKQ
ncbi:MAG: aminotransferase class IV, partial [Candidatus Omnitrophica bacterium]|nr:aminotransferase class IV [Candidatus Omnitrophota bacterium]